MDFEDKNMTIDNWKKCTGEPAIHELLASGQRYAAQLDAVGELISELNARRILLVVDRVAVTAARAGDCLDRQLRPFETEFFDDFSPNPRSEQGAAAARLAARHQAEAVVAIGGGSCLDVAKIAALAAPDPEKIEAVSRGETTNDVEPLPIVAVPTTSGTGSEATHFAVIYVDGKKMSVAHPCMRPIAVVLDQRLHHTMPSRLAAVTGLDALSQAMESLWAVGSTAESHRFATEAGKLIARSIEPSVLQGNPDARIAMMIGAHLAGQAINISKTTAAHALSYQLSQRLGLAHGHAVALTLGHIGAANHGVDKVNCIDPRGPEHVRRQVSKAAELLDCAPCDLPETVARMLDRLELPSNLPATGIDQDTILELADRVDPVRISNNPRRFSTHEIAALLERA